MALTLQEASKMFDIPIDTLQQYEENGLLQSTRRQNRGAGSYEEDDFRQLGLVQFLLDAGFTQREIKRYLGFMKENGSKEEQIRMLRKQRFELLEDIHEKQQILDRIDYMIWEKKKEAVQ